MLSKKYLCVIFIPLAALFGYLSNASSVFMAGWVLAAAVVFMAFFSLKVLSPSLSAKNTTE